MRKLAILVFVVRAEVMFGQTPPSTEELDKLANDFWAWRAKYAPFTADDVNRLERPGERRDWSAAAIDQRTRDLKEFDARHQKIATTLSEKELSEATNRAADALERFRATLNERLPSAPKGDTSRT